MKWSAPLVFALLLWPVAAGAQSLAPVPGAGAPPKMKAAPRVPVVQAPRHGQAQKSPARPRPVAKPVAPEVKPDVAAPVVVPAAPAPAPPAVDPAKGSVTQLPIPRFMSLRFDDVNLRVGPGTRYPIDWVYHRRDLPVEILRELDDWRLVRDQDNVRGWMRAPTLSPKRDMVVLGAERTLRAGAAADAAPVALLKPGVIGRLRSCAATSAWCEVEVGSYRGFVRRDEIYGVYPGEAVGG